MHSPMMQDQPFYPPRIPPCAKPLRFPFYLPKLVTNNLETLPAQAFEDLVVLGRGPPRLAWISGPNAVKAVLLDRAGEFPKGRVQNDVFRPLAGNAMTAAEGREWRWQRGAAAPLFRPDEIMRYGEVMSAAAEAIVATWRAAGPDRIHPIREDMKRAAFAVMSKTLLAGSAKTSCRPSSRDMPRTGAARTGGSSIPSLACPTGCRGRTAG